MNPFGTVFIFSSILDHSTNDVCDWIHYFGGKFKRIDATSLNDLGLASISLVNGKCKVKIDKEIVHSVWVRREIALKCENVVNNKEVHLFTNAELFGFSKAIFSSLLKSASVLGTNSQYSIHAGVNKFTILLEAVKVGLVIPNSILCTEKAELIQFIKQNGQIIIKPISEPVFLRTENYTYGMYTSILESCDVKPFEDLIFPCYAQQLISKLYEIRVFYIEGIIYSAAIFSQSNTQTSIDFRNYDDKKPNKVVPYLLPKGIKKQLCELMKRLNLNTGSIDMIYTTKNEYIFLEVNPIGQFGMVSKPCNYYLHRVIAKYLLQNT